MLFSGLWPTFCTLLVQSHMCQQPLSAQLPHSLQLRGRTDTLFLSRVTLMPCFPFLTNPPCVCVCACARKVHSHQCNSQLRHQRHSMPWCAATTSCWYHWKCLESSKRWGLLFELFFFFLNKKNGALSNWMTLPWWDACWPTLWKSSSELCHAHLRGSERERERRVNDSIQKYSLSFSS